MKLHIWRKTWSLFIGRDAEFDQWLFRWCWGGKSVERGINGLYWYRNHIEVAPRRNPRCFYRFGRAV